ncbi:MAG: glycoside hydrolase family 25 protein [Erythrobacter sp.]
MARSRSLVRRAWRRYLLGTLLLAALSGAAWYWWEIQYFAPDEAAFPEQGVAVSEAQGPVRFESVRALGGSFAYVEASSGGRGQDARFGRNLAAARGEGLKVGALHRFDPCLGADPQSANFVTMVPRDATLLPPAIAFEDVADHCTTKVSDAAVESEFMTFVNQVEMHSGRPAILKLSEAVEARYAIGKRIERDLWLVRDRFLPRYAGRPWLLWSANRARVTEAAEEPLEWVVVQP